MLGRFETISLKISIDPDRFKGEEMEALFTFSSASPGSETSTMESPSSSFALLSFLSLSFPFSSCSFSLSCRNLRDS